MIYSAGKSRGHDLARPDRVGRRGAQGAARLREVRGDANLWSSL